MLNLNSIMIGAENAQVLGDFYKKVLDMDPVHEDQGWVGFQVGSCFLTIGPHDKVEGISKNPERIMFNFETKELTEEFERIKAAGATVIAAPYSMEEGGTLSIATFADPEGNYFQLMVPWEA
ncbi:MAG: hypothetical protein QG639_561 [Patescibacteria group bacterium]|nr:hypothetical protein [Patescibacteria group bacterium]